MATFDERILKRDESVEASIQGWLGNLRLMFPAIKDTYDVPQIPMDDHNYINPLTELIAMRGGDHGIVVVDLEEADGQDGRG